MKPRNIVDSFNCAIEGFMYVLKTQRNMRIHFLIGIAVVLAGIWLNLTRVELVILASTIALVLIIEMVNTAVEYLIDLITDVYHPLARIIKDVSAGAVLLSGLNAIVVGYLIFSKELQHFDLIDGIEKIRRSPAHITFIILMLTLSVVVAVKVLLGKGTPLRGGMPSGHSAIAFAIWAIITYCMPSTLLSVLVLILAVFIAQSRIRPGLHSVWEVIAGALVGLTISILILKTLSI